MRVKNLMAVGLVAGALMVPAAGAQAAESPSEVGVSWVVAGTLDTEAQCKEAGKKLVKGNPAVREFKCQAHAVASQGWALKIKIST